MAPPFSHLLRLLIMFVQTPRVRGSPRLHSFLSACVAQWLGQCRYLSEGAGSSGCGNCTVGEEVETETHLLSL